MTDFESLVRAYLLASDVHEIRLRSGVSSTMTQDLSGVLPYLAWSTNVRSRILLAERPLEVVVTIDQQNRSLTCPDGIGVNNSNVALCGLSWALEDSEDGDLRGLDDAVSQILIEHGGASDKLLETPEVNAAMMKGYRLIVDGVRLENERQLDAGKVNSVW